MTDASMISLRLYRKWLREHLPQPGRNSNEKLIFFLFCFKNSCGIFFIHLLIYFLIYCTEEIVFQSTQNKTKTNKKRNNFSFLLVLGVELWEEAMVGPSLRKW